eukprot:1520888-Alexandrium_andersonii.AAC.1
MPTEWEQVEMMPHPAEECRKSALAHCAFSLAVREQAGDDQVVLTTTKLQKDAVRQALSRVPTWWTLLPPAE